jgi:hypothetical protein
LHVLVVAFALAFAEVVDERAQGSATLSTDAPLRRL